MIIKILAFIMCFYTRSIPDIYFPRFFVVLDMLFYSVSNNSWEVDL